MFDLELPMTNLTYVQLKQFNYTMRLLMVDSNVQLYPSAQKNAE